MKQSRFWGSWLILFSLGLLVSPFSFSCIRKEKGKEPSPVATPKASLSPGIASPSPTPQPTPSPTPSLALPQPSSSPIPSSPTPLPSVAPVGGILTPGPNASASPLAAQPVPPSNPGAAERDATLELKLVPGLYVNYQIVSGRNNSGRIMGDYESGNWVTQVDPTGGFTFRWTLTNPAFMTGTRTIQGMDRLGASQLSYFYRHGERAKSRGYTSLVFSQDLYNRLKAGELVPFSLDGFVKARTLQKVGEETFKTILNDQVVSLRTLKVHTENGLMFWILDNPSFPLLVKKDSLFQEKFIPSILMNLTYLDQLAPKIVEKLKAEKQVVTYGIFFQPGRPTLQEESRFLLDELVKMLRAEPTLKLNIEVHGDHGGGEAYSLQLTQLRAETLKNYLITSGVFPIQLDARGYGVSQPLLEDSPEGRAKNRRVVLKLQ